MQYYLIFLFFRVLSGLLGGKYLYDDLLDVLLADLCRCEPEYALFSSFARLGDMLEHLSYPAADSGIFALYHVLVEIEYFKQIADIEVSGGFIASVRELDDIGDYLVVLVVYLADKFLDDVLERDYALGAAVLIGNDREVYLMS